MTIVISDQHLHFSDLSMYPVEPFVRFMHDSEWNWRTDTPHLADC